MDSFPVIDLILLVNIEDPEEVNDGHCTTDLNLCKRNGKNLKTKIFL